MPLEPIELIKDSKNDDIIEKVYKKCVDENKDVNEIKNLVTKSTTHFQMIILVQKYHKC